MKLFRQYDSSDCGLACIRMLAYYYGKDFSLQYLRQIVGLHKEGLSIHTLRLVFQAIGMNARSYKIPASVLIKKCPLPVIIHWKASHFVVLYKVRKKRNNYWFYVADPAVGKRKYLVDTFFSNWNLHDEGIILTAEPIADFYNTIAPQKINIYHFLKSHFLSVKSEIFQLIIGMTGMAVFSFVVPILTQVFIDQGIGRQNIKVVIAILVVQFCIQLGTENIKILRSWIVQYMGTKVGVGVIFEFLAKLFKLPMSFFDTRSVGDINQRINDHHRLQSFVTSETLSTFFSFISFGICVVVIGIYNLLILGVYLVFVTISITWVISYLKKRKTLDYEIFNIRAEIQNLIFEIIKGISDIKLNNYQIFKLNEWKCQQRRQYKANIELLKVNLAQNSGYNILIKLSDLVVSFLVANAVINDNMTLGMMFSISYIIGQINPSIFQIVTFIHRFQETAISIERASEVHILPNEDSIEKCIPLSITNEDIILNSLYFSYGSIQKTGFSINELSFTIRKGITTAIVGESGCGKTTIIKLLLKFYKPQKGCVFVGQDLLSNIDSLQWRKQCGCVMQDNFVFSDTVKNNIILGAQTADEERLERAIYIANLNTFINSLPDGIYTRIGSDGFNISGGEKQRIMIARAIYKNPKYLFFDEPTSSLDAENERIIVSRLYDFFKGRTAVFAAHRLSTVRFADMIIVMNRGSIVEMGNHEQLIKSKMCYYNLVKSQLENSSNGK